MAKNWDDIKKESGKCYVLPKNVSNKIHINREVVQYPEDNLTLRQAIGYIPQKYDIVTDNPHLVSCFDVTKVYVLERNTWVHPRCQTFGADYLRILMYVFNIKQPLSSFPNMGIDALIKGESNMKDYIWE